MDVGRKGSLSVKFSRLFLLDKGYTKLEPNAPVDSDHTAKDLPAVVELPCLNATMVVPVTEAGKQVRQQSNSKRKWKLRLKPKVRIIFSRISSLIRLLRDSYLRAVIAVTARARKRSGALFPLVYKKKPRTAIAQAATQKGRSGDLNDVERSYMEYVQRSVTDGELAYYTMSLTSATGL